MRIVRPLQTTRRARTFAFVTSLLGAIGASQPSMAVTIGFGTSAGTVTPYVESGFTVDIARIVNGNCLSGACLALNDNEVSILSKVGGGVFTLDSFWFQLVGNGNPNQLTVTSYSDSTPITTIHLAVPAYDHNTGYVYSVAFPDITRIVFDANGGGNIRIDDINVSIAQTPLPSALPLFAIGLGVISLLGWRRKRKNSATLAA